MRFSVYLPPDSFGRTKVPVLYWLSGLTCTDENFAQKAGAFRRAAQLGIAIVMPDTSPRGDSVHDVPERYDIGKGAGFYVNATQLPWRENYQMFDYVSKELPALIESIFPVSSKRSIAGHSMGGHGAIVVALRHPDQYCSVSAFSPITHPSGCQWGSDAFKAYLGEDQSAWSAYDSVELIKNSSTSVPLLIDQGSNDEFLENQLRPHLIREAADSANFPLELQIREGYDHSYYFIATFIDEHLEFHARHLFT